jgi:alkylhydroperoxidase/carboxymuconolactone decarboxylase family protein YurZ
VLGDHAPEALAGYVQLRSYVISDHEAGLDLATKELLFVVLDVVYNNPPGALNHLDAAMAAGLQPQALLEALLQVLMVGGIQTWGKAGYQVFLAALERSGNYQGER